MQFAQPKRARAPYGWPEAAACRCRTEDGVLFLRCLKMVDCGLVDGCVPVRCGMARLGLPCLALDLWGWLDQCILFVPFHLFTCHRTVAF